MRQRRLPGAKWSAAILPRCARTPKRVAILQSLHKKLQEDGPKDGVGNRGFKRYLRAKGGVFEVDHDKIKSEALLDGIGVLQTNTGFRPSQVAARYKTSWMVEQVFRTSEGDSRYTADQPELQLEQNQNKIS